MPRAKARKLTSRKTSRPKKRRDYGYFLLFFIISIIALSGFFFRDVIKIKTQKFFTHKEDSGAGKKLVDDDEKIYHDKLVKKKEDIKYKTEKKQVLDKKEEYNADDKDYLDNLINNR